MCYRIPAPVVFAVLLLSLFVPGAEAQELAGSFEQLRVLVKRSDTVSVVDRTGTEVRGPISALSSSSLAIVVAGSQRTFLEGEIATIRQRRPDSPANGAKWGFGIGAGLGLLAGITLASGYDNGASALIPVLALTYGGIGAGVGVGIDALISSDQVIFARGGSAAKIRVRPILRAGRTGTLASFAF
jgi:hypothetical protein